MLSNVGARVQSTDEVTDEVAAVIGCEQPGGCLSVESLVWSAKPPCSIFGSESSSHIQPGSQNRIDAVEHFAVNAVIPAEAALAGAEQGAGINESDIQQSGHHFAEMPGADV